MTDALSVVVHHSGTPVQHTCRACTSSLKTGGWSDYQPAVPRAETRQTHRIWSESRAGQVGN